MSAVSGLETWRGKPTRFGERPLWCWCGHHVRDHLSARECGVCGCGRYVRDFWLPSAWYVEDVGGL
jgi:hypothetical protein